MLEVLSNPRCSKCRQALDLLQSLAVEHRVREYLKKPLTLDELRQLEKQLGLPPAQWMRERVEGDAEAQLQALAARPELLQRPIVIEGERALVARSLPELKAWLACSD